MKTPKVPRTRSEQRRLDEYLFHELDRAEQVREVGETRIPWGGPYDPRAILYQFPDGRLYWKVRLMEGDDLVERVYATDVLREFARLNGFLHLIEEIDELVERARRHAAFP
jgi:hypothetical protein